LWDERVIRGKIVPFASFTHARAETLIAGAFVLLAFFVMYEGARLGPGWGDSGPQSGFFPFSLAVLTLIGAVAILVQTFLAALRRLPSSPFIEDREEIVELMRVGLPIAVAIATVPVLGLYLMAAIYMALFAWWHGRFRWYTSLFSGAIFSAAVFALLSKGFRIPMPQSIWYGTYVPF
jgi:hypothetical protein